MLHSILNFLRTIFGMNEQRGLAILQESGTVLVPLNGPNAVTRVLQPAHTLRLRRDPAETVVPEPELTDTPLMLTWHGITDTGMVRDHNEDSFSFLDLGSRTLFVVADGMGGHDAGETASSIAVETVCSEVRNGNGRDAGPLALVERAVQKANAEVRREGARSGSNMGTTLTVALVEDNTAYIGSVGDSRLYWMENGSITQVTEDHSVVAKLVAAGKLTREEVRNHPRSNLLYRCIGTDESVKAGVYRLGLSKGGTLLLCTDGLWGELDDEEIRGICAGEQYTELICARLVQGANANGGKDNITAIVVKIS